LLLTREVITMPFRKVGANRYRSRSGRLWTGKQMRAYYATSGFKRKVRSGGRRRRR
jgi:hypothetical protein